MMTFPTISKKNLIILLSVLATVSVLFFGGWSLIKKIVGYDLSNSLSLQGVLRALKMAIKSRAHLGSPLIRALVRAERVKRAHGVRSPMWKRAIALRAKVAREMTDSEAAQAWELVDLERRHGPHKTVF